MKKISIALILSSLMAFSISASAKDVRPTPAPSQDPIVQHLKLSDEQVLKIKNLHKKLSEDINNIPVTDLKKGTFVSVIQSGKWDDAAIKNQIAAISKIQEQARYYRAQYYFNVSQILTPEQRAQVRADLAAVMGK